MNPERQKKVMLIIAIMALVAVSWLIGYLLGSEKLASVNQQNINSPFLDDLEKGTGANQAVFPPPPVIENANQNVIQSTTNNKNVFPPPPTLPKNLK